MLRRTLTLLVAMTAFPTTTRAGLDDVEPGVSLRLAQHRAATVSEVRYELRFQLEPGATEVLGDVTLSWARSGTDDVVLDLAEPSTTLLTLTTYRGILDGTNDLTEVDLMPHATFVHDHVVLPGDLFPERQVAVMATFRSPVASTGTPLTVYREPDDSGEYYYTLLVPADAHRLFPCFDQPDLKARFSLKLELPDDWTAVSNGFEQFREPVAEGRTLATFMPTEPISTYLFAFACGTFAVHETAPTESPLAAASRPMRILHRPSRAPHIDFATLDRMHRSSLEWLERYFGHHYPFHKLDYVLTPGFPYGGMEHPGAIFYRETALSFDHEPTVSELLRRSTLIYHEVSHQWFGNLVTMRWFDDLWLKEGFATFVGYRALDALEPERNAWLRFHQSVKPSAYRVDATAGTTPVYQPLHNLLDAKSNYGPIVYNKAPAILRELEARLGEETFREGVRLFVQRHAFGNATWQELIAALEEASEVSLERWSGRWITAPGMPTVRAEWDVGDDGTLTRFELVQAHASDDEPWPLHVRILLQQEDGARHEHTLGLLNERTRVRALEGRPAPSWVLLNPRDVEYGQFLVDEVSATPLLEGLAREVDPLVRSTAYRALYATVREGALDPRRFLAMALPMLERETDALTHASLLGPITTTATRYLDGDERQAATARLAALLMAQLQSGAVRGQELGLFRRVQQLARTPAQLDAIASLLTGTTNAPGLSLGDRDRIAGVACLLAAGWDGADDLLARLEAEAEGDVSRALYITRAARPDAETKASYFATYRNETEPPEQWVQSSLGTFHAPGQEALTLPYLRPALEQVEWVKEHRKIFFMPAWLDAFINAHDSEEALDLVRSFQADHPDLAPDIQLKLLQSVDALERTVRIRERWPAR